MAEALKEFNRLMESNLNDTYGLGYAHGEAAAIARIVQAAQLMPAVQQVALGTVTQSHTAGFDSRALVEAVLKRVGAAGATPAEIFRSPENQKSKISRDAIAKTLRRWTRNGRYVNRGGGRYVSRG